MAYTPSVVTPCRLASDTLLVAREAVQPMTLMLNKNLMVDLGPYNRVKLYKPGMIFNRHHSIGLNGSHFDRDYLTTELI